MIPILIAVALALGAHPAIIGIGWLAYAKPYWFLAAVTGWAIYSRVRRGRHHGPRAEAAFLEGIAGELRSGASLRGAIADAAQRTDLDLAFPVRLATAGRPMPQIAAALRPSLPVNGPVAAPALILASRSGTSVAPLFDALAVRAAEAAEEERERQTLTAQARLSAWLIGGVPAAIAGAIYLAGDVAVSSGPGMMIAIVGFGLQGVGAVAVWAMVRGGAR